MTLFRAGFVIPGAAIGFINQFDDVRDVAFGTVKPRACSKLHLASWIGCQQQFGADGFDLFDFVREDVEK